MATAGNINASSPLLFETQESSESSRDLSLFSSQKPEQITNKEGSETLFLNYLSEQGILDKGLGKKELIEKQQNSQENSLGISHVTLPSNAQHQLSSFIQLLGQGLNAINKSKTLSVLLKDDVQLNDKEINNFLFKNNFISQALSEQDLAGILKQKFSLSDLSKMFEIDKNVASQAEAAGVNLNEQFSVVDFLKAIGVDPQAVVSEISKIKTLLATKSAQASNVIEDDSKNPEEPKSKKDKTQTKIEKPKKEKSSSLDPSLVSANLNPTLTAKMDSDTKPTAEIRHTKEGKVENNSTPKIDSTLLDTNKSAKNPLNSTPKMESNHSKNQYADIDFAKLLNPPVSQPNISTETPIEVKSDPIASVSNIQIENALNSTSATKISGTSPHSTKKFATQDIDSYLKNLAPQENIKNLQGKILSINPNMEHNDFQQPTPNQGIDWSQALKNIKLETNTTSIKPEIQTLSENSTSETAELNLDNTSSYEVSDLTPQLLLAQNHQESAKSISEAKHLSILEKVEIKDKILNETQILTQEGGGTANIQFSHEKFGQVSLHVKVQGEIVDVNIQTDSPEMLKFLNSEVSSLSDSLRQDHLKLSKFEVSSSWASSSGFSFDQRSGGFDPREKFQGFQEAFSHSNILKPLSKSNDIRKVFRNQAMAIAYPNYSHFQIEA